MVKSRNHPAFERVHSLWMGACPFCASSTSDNATTCPSCGAVLGGLQLHAGTTFQNGALRLERVLGQGGFGITYLGLDTVLNRNVAVKELFPEGATRQAERVVPPASYGAHGFGDAKTRFLEEARTLAQFHHDGVIRVHGVFEENATAYMVMEYLEGETLGERLQRTGKISEHDVKALALEICAALEVIHAAGLLHRDIKPDNIYIYLTSDGRVVLIDFGSARSFVSSQPTGHTRLVSAGYAAPEQYASSAKFGPYTDIYGLSATLYHALAGQAPPSAMDRFVGGSIPALPSSVSTGLKDALERGLKLNVTERPQSIAGFQLLFNDSNVPDAPKPRNSKTAVVEIAPGIAVKGGMLEVDGKRHSLEKIIHISIEEQTTPSAWIGPIASIGFILFIFVIASAFTKDGSVIVVALLMAGLYAVLFWVLSRVGLFRDHREFRLVMQKSGRNFRIYESKNCAELEGITQRLTPYL